MRYKQLPLKVEKSIQPATYYDNLVALLQGDLDFHSQDANYASHNFHSFPAKFPPQLPEVFINTLTKPGDIVLDPMTGSGTTILEAHLANRIGIGFDIDPLAIMIAYVKTNSLDKNQLYKLSHSIIVNATQTIHDNPDKLINILNTRWKDENRAFIDHWFTKETQIELVALLSEIEQINDVRYRNFFLLAFSAIIITKTGGVSLALDLAHTRPHRAKVILTQQGDIIEGKHLLENPLPNIKYATKTLRSPLVEFQKKVLNNISNLALIGEAPKLSNILIADAQSFPLKNNCVDLIVTSPPYASNAIDYMRAHKFTLIWLGYSLKALSGLRGDYIGGESNVNEENEARLSPHCEYIIAEISRLDRKKGQVLRRYYSEMTRVIREMYRVLKPGKAAIMVIGNSQMRGRDTETQNCLADIGRMTGFEVPAIGIRRLDRNRRMLPAGLKIDHSSQIQQRMHQEYVIGFYKPDHIFNSPGR